MIENVLNDMASKHALEMLKLEKERDQARAQLAVAEKVIEEIEQMTTDGVVICRKCGDEETLQDSDLAHAVRDYRMNKPKRGAEHE